MAFDPSDSSGTDDDLPPTHQNRGIRGHVTGNGRNIVGAIPYARMQNDMEFQIHRIEQEAYSSILRAFKAQSDAITWEKESLITELRKELRVSDEEHRELLSRVNADDIIRRIREWRQAGGLQSGVLNNVQPDGGRQAPSPTISASRKRQRTSQPARSLSLDAPSPGLYSQPIASSMQPSLSAAKRVAATGAKGKKPKSGQGLPSASSMKSMQYSSAGPSGRGLIANRNSSGAPVIVEPAKKAPYDPLIGRIVMTRWPADNHFYEAVITDYNPVEGLHALVYDKGTNNETWEWVNLKEISPEDIRWEGEDPDINYQPGQGAPGRKIKKSTGRGDAIPGAGRGRETIKNQPKKDFPTSQNGVSKKNTGDIEILHTETLIKEVEKVFGASHPDPLQIEKAKKVLKDHEQSLIDAIARLADASDGEREDDEHQFSHEQYMERDGEWRNEQYGGKQHRANHHEDDMITGEGGEDSDGHHLIGDGVASGYQHHGDNDDT
ncbi:protein EMSY-LIKE 3 isoform X1 [Musa acuminata AAA Group]|uniref:protein EMSY-LIKE 3 isoform X1 n=2 Tax=Musa acuminata AAA Group TaxID=214697 RepID=UPI0031CF33B9